jgi:L-amino acid N-acyltransferase YncA
MMESLSESYFIREATPSDVGEICNIYNYYVLKDGDMTTFEESPISLQEMHSRYDKITNEINFPFLVACAGGMDGPIAGYAYSQGYKPRHAYRFSAEDSIYLHPSHCGKGLGSRLLSDLLNRLKIKGIKQVVAVIGTEEDNPASMYLHSKLGFKLVGTYPKIGFKYGKWVDRCHMQKSIDDED